MTLNVKFSVLMLFWVKIDILNKMLQQCVNSTGYLIKQNHVVIDRLVKFEKEPVEIQEFRNIIVHFRGIMKIKNNQKVITCHRADFGTTRILTNYA